MRKKSLTLWGAILSPFALLLACGKPSETPSSAPPVAAIPLDAGASIEMKPTGPSEASIDAGRMESKLAPVVPKVWACLEAYKDALRKVNK